MSELSKAVEPVDRAAVYAQSGIWFETVQTLAESLQMKETNPNACKEWTLLLQAAKLDKVIPYSFTTLGKDY